MRQPCTFSASKPGLESINVRHHGPLICTGRLVHNSACKEEDHQAFKGPATMTQHAKLYPVQGTVRLANRFPLSSQDEGFYTGRSVLHVPPACYMASSGAFWSLARVCYSLSFVILVQTKKLKRWKLQELRLEVFVWFVLFVCSVCLVCLVCLICLICLLSYLIRFICLHVCTVCRRA